VEEEEHGGRPRRRRGAGILVAIVVALLAADLVTGLIASDDEPKPASAPYSAPVPPFKAGMPYREPPVVSSRGGELKTTLVAQNGTVEVSGVQIANTETYATASTPRGFLGPTLHVEPGDVIDLTLDNRLKRPADVQRKGQPDQSAPTCPPAADPAHKGHHAPPPPPDGGQITNLHYHGMHVTPTTRTFEGQKVYGDNVLLNLPPGKSRFRFQVPKDHDQGTFWYHAHRHGCTDDQVFRGLAGLLLVGDVRRKLPPRFRHVRTRSLALKDIEALPFEGGWAIPNDHDWALNYNTRRTVNGLLKPTMTMRPGETQLWRVVNTSAAVWYRVAVVDAEVGSEPSPWDAYTVVAEDGNPATRPQRMRSTVLGPGHRIDILVRAPAGGTRELRTLPFDQGRETFPEETLATVKVEGNQASPVASLNGGGRLPHFPSKRGPTRHFTFSFVPRPGTHPSGFAFINGLPFDPHRVDARPRLGTTEKWVLINRSNEWHPFHIHQDDFRVISVNGKRVSHPPGDQDVVGLPPVKDGVPGRVEILMPFQTFKGNFVFHCHILDHEDAGMMARVDVLGPRR
jgi:FtsP/CotA-like multicopper oxidase with cupredoxin domain